MPVEQTALAVPSLTAPEPEPPTYWECRGPHDWQPVLVACRYGNTRGLTHPVFPLVVTKPIAPRNVQIVRTDGHQRVVPVRSLRCNNPALRNKESTK